LHDPITGKKINTDVVRNAITDLRSTELSVDYEHAIVKNGVLQVLPIEWVGEDKNGELTSTLNISKPNSSIFTLLTDFEKGMEVGAKLHLKHIRQSEPDLNPYCPECKNESSLEQLWSNVFWYYNSAGKHYRIKGKMFGEKVTGTNDVVRRGAYCYEPRYEYTKHDAQKDKYCTDADPK
jgi:hypothetical protein